MAEISIINGLAGGIVATIVMTVFMMVLGDDSPPPTAALWSKYVGDGPPEEFMPQGMLLHMLYGISAGAAFAVLFTVVGLDISLVTTVGLGVAYGIVLTIVGAVLWMNVVLDMDPDPQMIGLFTLFHLVYGVVLGGFVSVGLL
jgi:hypothetical protein